MLYLWGVVLNRAALGWNARQTLLAAALSVVPGGTFWVTGRMMPRAKENGMR